MDLFHQRTSQFKKNTAQKITVWGWLNLKGTVPAQITKSCQKQQRRARKNSRDI